MKTEMKMEKLEDISPAHYNPRQIDEDEFEKLKKGLAEFGMVQPLVANQDGTLIGGHQRLRAAFELEWTEVPVIRIDVDKQREKALNLALNRLSGKWDYPKLTSLLNEFEADMDFDMELTGFGTLEAADLTSIGGDGAFEPGELIAGGDFNGGGTTSPSALLDPIGGTDEKTTIKGNYIQFGRYKAPMSEDEKERMSKLAIEYIDENGSLYGFATRLMDEAYVQ